MKKILAIVLALSMVLAMALTVSADDAVIREGDLTLTVSADYWEEIPSDGMFTADEIPNITKIVFTSDNTSVNYVYSSIEVMDASKNSHWNQTSGVTEFTVDFANLYTENETDTDGNTAPYVKVFASSPSGTQVTVHYVVYGAAAAEAPADDAAAEAPAADDTAAAPADEAPAANDAPAAEAPAAPSTGIALAVIPAVIAMAAVAVSKKH